MTSLRLLILIPAYNEAASIGGVVRSIYRTLPGTPALVVDDHSSDGTSCAASAAGAQVIRLRRHAGLAGCLHAGYRFAFENGFDYVVRVDGDGQHEPADIPHLVRALQETGADIVVGSRFLGAGRWRSSATRRAGIAILRLLTSQALGRTIHDPTSGFIGVNQRTIELFSASEPPPYPEVGALIALNRNRCSIHEIPCRMYPRTTGRSSMTALNSMRYAGGVLEALLTRKLPRKEVLIAPFHAEIPEIRSRSEGSPGD